MGWSGEGMWKNSEGQRSDSGGGGSGYGGEGFSAFGMGGKSGALGKYDYVGGAIDQANPWLQADKARRKKAEEDKARAQELYEKTQGINQKFNAADTQYKGAFDTASTDYLGNAKKYIGDYQSIINGLSDQSKKQATDATNTYTNVLLPEMKNALEMSKKNAESAMTLEEAGDPNNAVQKAVRGMYDKLGETERMRGQQDFGVLSALGAQAAGLQFGAGSDPMTSGMMGQIYSRNQEQAGNAYAEAMRRVRDLQQQGINRGFDQSNWLYEQGQQAQDRYGQRIGQYQDLERNYNADQAGYRQEQQGYAGDILGTNAAYNTDVYNMGMTGAGIDRDNAYAGTGREQTALNQLYGGEQQAANNEAAAGQANNASKGQFISSIAQLFAGMSDRREKQSISDLNDKDLNEFLDAIEGKKYKYKDTSKPGTAEGNRYGFMMQDVQGTKLGDAITHRGPRGELMYDKENLNGIVLAALAKHRREAA